MIDVINSILNYLGITVIVLQTIIGMIVGVLLGLIYKASKTAAQVAVEKKTEFAYVISFAIGVLLLYFSYDLSIALNVEYFYVFFAGVAFVLLGISKLLLRGVKLAKGNKGIKEA